MAVDISVVVPTYQRPELLAACLESLAGQDVDPAAFEVVVVDDGSGEATAEVLRSAARDRPGLRWESLPANRGPAAARNRAVALATGRWILFLDDDMVAPPGLVAAHLGWLRGGDDHFGVVGLVAWLPGIEVTPFMRWLDAGDVQFAFGSMGEGPVVPPSRAFYTCNVSLSRSLFLEVGGFDERFPYAAYEDTELAVRLAAKSFHLDHRRSALAWHARPVTLPEFAERMERVGEAAVLFSRLHPGASSLVDLEGPRATGWRRRLRRAVLAVGAPLGARYYQEVVSDAFCRGADRASGRGAGGGG
jgi:GT2 family glycosyltransferase